MFFRNRPYLTAGVGLGLMFFCAAPGPGSTIAWKIWVQNPSGLNTLMGTTTMEVVLETPPNAVWDYELWSPAKGPLSTLGYGPHAGASTAGLVQHQFWVPEPPIMGPAPYTGYLHDTSATPKVQEDSAGGVTW